VQKVWKIKGKFEKDIIDSLLKIRDAENKDYFLNPPNPALAFEHIKPELLEAVSLIKLHISQGSFIFVHGDYDVDGICATAILWKTIYFDLQYKNCLPFIPDRFEDGYGLSKESIDKIKSKADKGLIVTVDCGVTAQKECKYAKTLGFDVTVTDHHQKNGEVLECSKLVWTDKLVGSSIALALSSLLIGEVKDEYLSLAALATVSDIQPLVGFNRSVVKYGLEILNARAPLGIKVLMEASGIKDKVLSTYELGWILSPRLNASGRLESAMDSLKLLCTKNESDAMALSEKLGRVNYERQQKTALMFELAKSSYLENKKIIISSSRDYHEGVIGLVAGKLSQEFYKPSVLISVGDEVSKGSARSVEGVNIIELLRRLDFYESVGGHPQAAGFSIKTADLEKLIFSLEDLAEEFIDEVYLSPVLNIDLEIPSHLLSLETALKIRQLEPFGFGNHEPLFMSSNLKILNTGVVGRNSDHLKLRLGGNSGGVYDAIFFGGGNYASSFSSDSFCDVAFSLRENVFNGISRVSLNVKDIKHT